MRKRRFMVQLTLMTAILLLAASLSALAATVPRMSTDELKSHLGEEGYLVLDVRANRDWANSQDIIAGAERVAPGSVNQWADNYDKNQTLVLYCA